MEYTCHYDSPLGGITIASDGSALTGLWFDGQKYFAQTLDPEHENKSLPVLEETCKWLDIYFDGKAPDFMPPLSMKTTVFRKAGCQPRLSAALWGTIPSALSFPATACSAQTEASQDMPAGSTRRPGCSNWSTSLF